MIPGDLLSAFPHRQFHTLPGLLDSWAALPNSNPNACVPMQGGSLYHFYDGLWYDPAERRTHDLPCERRTRYRLSQPDTVYQEVIQGRANINVSYNWAAQIKHILDESGFTYVWNTSNQFDVLPNFLSIKQRIIDQYMQLWSSNINESSKLNWYRLFKNNFSLQTETYLNCINNCKLRNALCKFRLPAHSLEIETGRYNATPLEQRICKFCTSPHVENEYHFFC